MAARRLAMRSLATALLLVSIAGAGCSPQPEAITLVIPLRDDCVPSDVEALQSILLADDRVTSCDYVSENVSLTQEASTAATLTPGPDGDPWHEAWLEVVITGGQDEVLASLESHPVFDRAVRASDSGDWWQVQ